MSWLGNWWTLWKLRKLVKKLLKEEKMVNFFKQFNVFLAGKKTYFLSASAILTAIIAYSNGALDMAGLVKAIFEAVTAATIRAGIAKK
mgnify:FL=1